MKDILQKQIKAFMTKDVLAVKKDETIKHLFQLMDSHGILSVPIVDESNVVVGIVTESNLIKHFTTLKNPQGIHLLGSMVYLEDLTAFNEKLKDHCSEVVADLMSNPVVTISPEATLLDALNLMTEEKVNRLPVVDEGHHLMGIITRTDVLHQLAQIKKI
ncbi:hypothetical protein COY07_04860 [Candidatus Peregrinibacteria bacterium CG_4_10_14_0_2_um_filter_43_11]|nr:MAG: hypothetical protein COY07_04860 [Candidatus Peregrinibacteria bacterium CG_4_10_14_0_2_um_filter_43_11]